MKNTLALSGIGGLAAAMLICSFTFPEIQDQKKQRHVKLTKVENGKTMHLDTMLTGDQVFIWNGDTIRPEKHIKKYSPAEFDRLHNTDRLDQKKRMRIIQRADGESGDHLIMPGDSGEDFEIFTEEGDSARKNIMIHKRLRDGQEKDHFIFLNGDNGHNFPPIPPMPPVPHIQRFRGDRSNRSINLNDPNVISFKKKDISGGREKIEIIRKKTKETEEFDFEMNHMIDVPEPPEAPVMDEQQLMEMEKKVEKDIKKAEKQMKKAEEQKNSQKTPNTEEGEK